MRFHKQEFLHDPENRIHGDCGRAVIASFLDLPLADVPHEHREMTGAEYNEQMDAFLARHGVTRIWISFKAESVDEALEWATQWSNSLHCVLMDTSPRGSNHVVIAHEGKIVHDPHPDDGGLVGPTDNGNFYVEWLVRPAKDGTE